MAWLMLAAAILGEVVATLALRAIADGVRPLLVVLVVVGYSAAFVLMAGALRSLDVGLVYAIWSGVGTAAVAAAGAVLYGERLTLAAIGGIVLIVAGVAVLAATGSIRGH
jgi:small multidrug resistance pump